MYVWTELVWLCVHHDTKDFQVPRTPTYSVLSSYNTYNVRSSWKINVQLQDIDIEIIIMAYSTKVHSMLSLCILYLYTTID